MPPPVVLITGCSKGGIGFNLAEEFAEKGCVVYASARRPGSMEGFSRKEIRTVTLDVTNDGQVLEVVRGVIDEEGRIDVVVNAAGTMAASFLADTTIEEAKAHFDANFWGAFRVAKAVIPHMAEQKSGLIINFGSMAGDIPAPFSAIYNASKAALHAMTENLRLECQLLGIDVTLVIPGAVHSNVAANWSKSYHMPPTSYYKAYLKNITNRVYVSQGPSGMEPNEFAKEVVRVALLPTHPPRLEYGPLIARFKIMRWLPRNFVIGYLWRRGTQLAK